MDQIIGKDVTLHHANGFGPAQCFAARKSACPVATFDLKGRADVFRRNWFAWCLCVTLWGGTCASGQAQTSAADAPKSAAPAAPKAALPGPLPANGDALSGDVMYLPGPDGKELVPVPVGASLKEYLNWLQAKTAAARPAPAPYSISSLEFEGKAEDDRVLLTSTIRVHVTQPDSWVRVPLQLPEAILRGSAHSGPGEAVSDLFDAEKGFTWWFKGAGVHELRLDLSIPLRKPISNRRLLATLPATIVSSLKLRVPFARVAVKVAERSTVTIRPLDGGSEIEVYGLGTRLDLSWQPVLEAAAAETVLEAATSINASLVDGESLTLEASQRIQALHGTFDELRVSLPPTHELLRVDGLEIQEHYPNAADANQIILKLKKATAGPVEVKWTVRSPLPSLGTPIVLEGFEVARARIQTGFIAVSVVGDFQVAKQPDADRYLQRANLGDLPPAMRQSQAAAGYRFLNQPFRLVLNLRKVEPLVRIDSTTFVHFTPDLIDLELLLPVQIFRGSLSEVRLNWPNWRPANWSIESVDPPGRVEQVVTDDDANPGLIRILLTEPAKESFELRLHIRRMLPHTTEPISFTLPTAEGAGPATILGLSSADNVELNLQAEGSAQLRGLSAPAQAKANLLRDSQKSRRAWYRVEGLNPTLTARMVLHQQTIKAASTIRANSVVGNLISIRQKLQYDVAYERLSQVRLSVPTELKPNRVRFYLASGVELTTVWAKPLSRKTHRDVQLALEQPRIGGVEIEARFTVDPGAFPADAASLLAAIPVIQSSDAPWTALRFDWQDAIGWEASIQDPGWSREPSSDGAASWTTTTPTDAVHLQLARSTGGAARGGITKALLQTLIDREGLSETRGQYRIGGGLTALPVAFPAGVEPLEFFWDKQRLTPARMGGDRELIRYEISLPQRAAAEEHLLTIVFRTREHALSHFSDEYRLPMPQFPVDLWWTAQTLWKVVLPDNQHLFAGPAGFSPEYQWRQQRIFWHRHGNQTDEHLAAWIANGTAVPGPASTTTGNSYLFSQFGPPRAMEFQTMSQSGLVLIGAGLALVLGLLLVKVPVTRHVLTVLTIGFGIALAGVWRPDPILLLLQPAGLGLLLAIGAAGIDSMMQRRRQRGVVTLTSPSGFMTPPSSVNHEGVVGVGSEEFTTIRPGYAAPQEVGPTAESGSRA